MSKLWIVHRKPTVRAALARATGLPGNAIATGAPALADFANADAPDAILLGLPLEADLEAEIAFVEAARPQTVGARWIVLTAANAMREARRLFAGDDTAIFALPPDRASLRAEIAAAFDRDRSRPRDELRGVDRTTARFEAWLGGTQLGGLARALDPALRGLPLLVRGRAGSGRALLVQHAERSRGGSGRLLRVDARGGGLIDRLLARLTDGSPGRETGAQTIWVDAADAMPAADQRILADWIMHELVPGPLAHDGAAAALRWLATAGPAGLEERLEPALARAFVPLTIEVPPLDRAGDEIARIADRVAKLWAEATGTRPRHFADSALAALAEEPWWGERAELDAVLRATLANATTPRIEAADLRFPDAIDGASGGSVQTEPGEPSSHALRELPIDREADPSSELLALTDAWAGAAATSDPTRAAAPAAAEPTPEATSAAGPIAPAAPRPTAGDPNPAWRRLARSLAHEIRNPLVSIRTFTELLPDHYADETFRIRFKELVGKDVAHIQDVVARLARAAERDRLQSLPVDVSSLVERLLESRRERIAGRRLVVLSELERDAPQALADTDALETALAGLVDRALDSLPDRGDLFVTTRHIPRAGDGRPRLRVLLRHHNPLASGLSGELDPVNHILEYVLAETLVSAQGGQLTIDPTLGPETLIVIDLPAPPSSADA
ncbi:MAG: hypothetical protein IPK00_12950 [Deltaproteobacteria bacterium]|nr:hypothetical protein [Deltaproteobacteria bacterium]